MGFDGSEKKRKRKITEEDIAEYLAKKAQKKAAKVAKKLKLQNISGHSDESNPFGDSNLSERFVWRKKIERDIAQGVPLDEYTLKAEKKRHRERVSEIEKMKKRREERAIEKRRREDEMAILARERARAEFEDWEKKEEEFQFDQSKARSEIRLLEGRTKPIDVLIKHLNLNPLDVFKGLNVKEMEELHKDIKLHLDSDRATPAHTQYWEALLVVCDWELWEARKKHERLPEERGMHSSIDADVKNLLHGKSFAELEVLRSEIESQMSSGAAKVVEYWEVLLQRLQIFKAKAFLKEIHAKHLHGVENPEEEDRDAKVLSPEPIVHEDDTHEEDGSFSPELFHGDGNKEAVDPEEDKAILERKRLSVLEERRLQELTSRSEDNFEKKALKAMGAMEEGDAIFGSSDEFINLDSQVYWWHDKFLPRKPKYFNRVHTGYEWTKYNQTHYDHDNPPPKTVQGYKFNIFYPDLLDKGKAPTYTIEKDGDSTQTCIIRFHAGPPYEDIAFRIVNSEWEYSHKRGFKSTFERGILHLYFNIKRHRYRR